MHRSLVFLFLLASSFFVYGQQEQARKRVERLCSQGFHGRGYVNGGDSIAAIYLANEFDSIGLKPLNKTFFQEFKFDVNSFPGRMELTSGGTRLIPGVDFIIDPASPSMNGIFQTLRVDKDVLLNNDNLRDFVATIKDLEDHVLIIKTDPFQGDTSKIIRQLAHEFTAIMPVFIETRSKFTWSVAQSQSRYPLIEVRPGLVTSSVNVQIEAELIKGHNARNVIAFVPGKKKCSKKVVFTAHYDHLGRMGKNVIFPGANDNASGTAMLLTMADHFVSNRPKYDTYFIAFAGEEVGLLGSKHFVEHPLFPLKKIKYLVNLDIMGSGEEGITVVNATVNPQMFERLVDLNSENTFLTQIKSRGPAANSDHYWFAEAGVPAIFIYTMGPNKNYHDIYDTYDALSFQAYDAITQILISFAKGF